MAGGPIRGSRGRKSLFYPAIGSKDTAVEMTRKATRQYKVAIENNWRASSGSSARTGANEGEGNGPPTEGLLFEIEVTIPNNSTVDIGPFASDDYGFLHIEGGYFRDSGGGNTARGTFEAVATHDGTNAEFTLVEESPLEVAGTSTAAGFDNALFAGSIAAGELTLTLAADNAGGSIDCWLRIRWFPLI